MKPSLRPCVYDASAGFIVLHLTNEDLEDCYRIGLQRRQVNQQAGNIDGAFKSGQGARLDVEGIIGEYALALLGGEKPDVETLVLPFAQWKRARGVEGGELLDYRGTEVRTAPTWPDDDRGPLGIFIHKDMDRDRKKSPDTKYILAIIKNLRPYENETYNYSIEVRFPGWCLHKDVREDHWFDKGAHPEYRIPQHELRSMGELAPDLFILPKTLQELKEERETQRRQQELQAADELLNQAFGNGHVAS